MLAVSFLKRPNGQSEISAHESWQEKLWLIPKRAGTQWINKTACPFSLATRLAMTDTLLAEASMPRPRSLFTQHLPQLHLCGEGHRQMLIGRCIHPPQPLFLIRLYVCTALMTSLLSHPLHPDIITFLLFVFFLSDGLERTWLSSQCSQLDIDYSFSLSLPSPDGCVEPCRYF